MHACMYIYVYMWNIIVCNKGMYIILNLWDAIHTFAHALKVCTAFLTTYVIHSFSVCITYFTVCNTY